MNSDFKDLLSILNAHKVRYLVVGGYAVMKYTEPRYTKDLDLWVDASAKNARAVFEALRQFGAPLKDLSAADFAHKGSVYQMGRPRRYSGLLMCGVQSSRDRVHTHTSPTRERGDWPRPIPSLARRAGVKGVRNPSVKTPISYWTCWVQTFILCA